MFVSRQTVLEDGFCKHDRTQATPINPASPIVVPDGSLATIVGCDGETAVVRKMTSCTQIPYGWFIEEIRTEYNPEYVPYRGQLKKDMGSKRIRIGDPVTILHLGLASTTVYDKDYAIVAGDFLYASASGTLCVASGTGYCQSGWNNLNPVARAINSLTRAQMAQGRYLHINCLI